MFILSNLFHKHNTTINNLCYSNLYIPVFYILYLNMTTSSYGDHKHYISINSLIIILEVCIFNFNVLIMKHNICIFLFMLNTLIYHFHTMRNNCILFLCFYNLYIYHNSCSLNFYFYMNHNTFIVLVYIKNNATVIHTFWMYHIKTHVFHHIYK